MPKQSTESVENYDVAIIGAGPAGCAAALTLLLYSELNVVVIDPLSSRVKPGESLPPSIIPLLEYIQADTSFFNANHQKVYQAASAWGTEKILSQAFIFGGEGYSWHIDRNAFEAALQQDVRNRGGTFYAGSVRSTNSNGNDWEIGCDIAGQPKDLNANFLIDASGRSARFSRKTGAQRNVGDHLVAAYSFFEHDMKQDTIPGGATLIESVENGWWYSAGLPNDQMIITYFSDSDLIQRDKCHDKAGWLKALEKTVHTRQRLPTSSMVDNILVNSASSHYLEPAYGKNWIAAGDAVLSVDPLSSMGIGLALLTGIHAARVGAAISSGQKIEDGAYSQEVSRQYADYQKLKAHYYAQELRWRDSPFWQRRTQQG